MSVRSTRLGMGSQGLGAASLVYTVPAGKRTIVRRLSAINESAAFARLVLEVFLGSTSRGIISVAFGAHGTLDESKHVEIWLVLNAGEAIYVSSSANSIDWALSGAELVL